MEVFICTYLTQIRKLNVRHPLLALRRAQNLTQIRKLNVRHPVFDFDFDFNFDFEFDFKGS